MRWSFDHLYTDHPAVLPSFHVRDAFGLLAGKVYDLPQGGLPACLAGVPTGPPWGGTASSWSRLARARGLSALAGSPSSSSSSSSSS